MENELGYTGWQVVPVSAQRTSHAFYLLGKHPQTPLAHDGIMQLCCFGSPATDKAYIAAFPEQCI